jgi:hypothetical protein
MNSFGGIKFCFLICLFGWYSKHCCMAAAVLSPTKKYCSNNCWTLDSLLLQPNILTVQ